MKENIAIVSFLESFEFPLREATRKQVWWHALALKSKDANVTIYIVGKKKEDKIADGINIRFIHLIDIVHIEADRLYCITGSVQLSFPIFLFKKVCRRNSSITLTDGDMLGNTKRNLRKLIAQLIPFMFGTVSVFSEYQKNRLKLSVTKITKPYLPDVDTVMGGVNL